MPLWSVPEINPFVMPHMFPQDSQINRGLKKDGVVDYSMLTITRTRGE